MQTQIILCNADQIRIEFSHVAVRGIEHQGSVWFNVSGGNAVVIDRYCSGRRKCHAYRQGTLTDATLAADAKLVEIMTTKAQEWLATAGQDIEAKRIAELDQAVIDAEEVLRNALAAVEAARAMVSEAEKNRRAIG